MADLSINGKTILKWILRKQGLRMQPRFRRYITGYNRSICHSELPDIIEGRKFLHYLTADLHLINDQVEYSQ